MKNQIEIEHSEHAEYHLIEIICYPFYIALLIAVCIVINLNKKKFRKRYPLATFLNQKNRYRVDEIFLFCAVYLLNVLVTWNFFDFIPKFGRFIITMIIIFVIQYFVGRIQIIGITGGIACGKSTVLKYFTDFLKLKYIDCDQLSRDIVVPGMPAYKMIVERFGNEILENEQPNAPIDRKVLGNIVFANRQKRQILTSITNKYIFLAILKSLWKICFLQKEQYVVLDAPLLFESKVLAYLCYPIITVYLTSESEQCRRQSIFIHFSARVCLRDNCSEEHALQRIRSQMPLDIKIKLSDVAICNDGTEKQLINQLQKKVFDYLV